MVRRWSCINQFNLNLTYLAKFDQKFKVKFFLSLVRLKKFFYLFTKFKRKSLSRIKHKTTWLVYSNVFKLWTRDYCFIKKYAKSQFVYNIFLYGTFFYNMNFIKNKTSTILSNNFNFVYFFFTRKFANYHNRNLNTFKHVNMLYSFHRHPIFVSSQAIPICFQFSNELFCIKDLNLDFFISETFLLNLVLSRLAEIYKILITLNYYFITSGSFNVK